MHAKVCELVAEIREDGGPRFIEFSTYRWLEHCGPSYDNHIGYRSESEFLEWQEKEPIARFERVHARQLNHHRQRAKDDERQYCSRSGKTPSHLQRHLRCQQLIVPIVACTLSNRV